jgi:hypothetical protein
MKQIKQIKQIELYADYVFFNPFNPLIYWESFNQLGKNTITKRC